MVVLGMQLWEQTLGPTGEDGTDAVPLTAFEGVCGGTPPALNAGRAVGAAAGACAGAGDGCACAGAGVAGACAGAAGACASGRAGAGAEVDASDGGGAQNMDSKCNKGRVAIIGRGY